MLMFRDPSSVTAAMDTGLMPMELLVKVSLWQMTYQRKISGAGVCFLSFFLSFFVISFILYPSKL